MTPHDIRLGLIGDNIAASRAPRLHELAGAQNSKTIRYDRLVPREIGDTFDGVFDGLEAQGYRGSNITYPYKEHVVKKVTIEDPLVRAIGAVNTVIFDGKNPPKGFNTDYSGFVAAYERSRKTDTPGTTLMIGTGGVGRAVAFGLIALGVTELRLVDMDLAKAEALADDLRGAAPDVKITAGTDAPAAANGADGLINCTPVGMVGKGGTPLAGAAMSGAKWAFDAVYTPVETAFLIDAAAAGLSIISGWELFFYQGVHAWALFTGLPLDETRLRQDLLS